MKKNKENDNGDLLLLVSLNKLTMKKNEFHVKANQLITSENMMQDNELSGKTDQLPVHIRSLKVSKYAPEENPLSSSQGLKLQKTKTKPSL